MDKKQAIDLASQFAKQVASEMSPVEIILYGSYARNRATDNSDIDVAIIFNEFSGNRIEASKRLWRIAWDSEGYIEPVILESLHDPFGFVSEVRNHGIVLYQSANTN
jgi:predicted nucleotidyltransferase